MNLFIEDYAHYKKKNLKYKIITMQLIEPAVVKVRNKSYILSYETLTIVAGEKHVIDRYENRNEAIRSHFRIIEAIESGKEVL